MHIIHSLAYICSAVRRHAKKAFVALAFVLLIFIYFTPFAFDNPALHPFADGVGTGKVPLVFIHGLGSTPSTMFGLQERLEEDGLYVNGKDLFNDVTVCDYARKTGKAMSFSLTYYSPSFGRPIDQFSAAISRTVLKAESSEIFALYAETLRNQLRAAAACTGANEVDVVAYSMGGIIINNLLRQNVSIRNVHYLGSSQRHGIYGNKTLDVGFGTTLELGNIQDVMNECKRSSGRNIIYSTLSGTDLSLQCQVLEYGLIMQDAAGSAGMATHAKSVIAGDIDGIGDGLVMLNATTLEGMTTIIVNCEHNRLRSPVACPQAYDALRTTLGGNEWQRGWFDSLQSSLLHAKLWLRAHVSGN
jgi:hypothetical protein